MNLLISSRQVQFVLIMTHQFQLLFTECDYPRTFMIWIGLHGLLFLGLFSDFYKAKYTGKSARSRISGSSSSGAAVGGNGNVGACMPVLEEEAHKHKQNGISSYATIYNKEYNSCYSNGTNNGYVANNNASDKKLA
jgi:elongation of very long chain fatty acids protein 7